MSSTSTASDKDSGRNEALELYHKFRDCKDRYISVHLNSALDIISDALRLYGPSQLISSFNGGKDAVVIMHLLRAATAKYAADRGVDSALCRPQFVYYAIKNEFPEVLEFINESEKLHQLELKKYDSGIAQGLAEQIRSLGENSTPAFILGTRIGDPNCGNQQFFSPSSSWMPAFMRVNPILNWEYGHVWHFLRTFSLPYCVLYDRGYTSLGKTTDTFPNPALRRKTASDVCGSEGDSDPAGPGESDGGGYWPAYMLADWTLERAGRAGATTSKTPTVSVPSSSSVYSSSSNDCALDASRINHAAGSGDSIDSSNTPTAAMIVIGDEILNAQTTEVNMQVASKELGAIGIPLRRVSIISDDISEIADEVRKMSQKYDIVITSGGIGPTHDDVTLKGIAEALDQQICASEVMLAHLRNVNKAAAAAAGQSEVPELTESMKRLAFLPEHSRLLFVPEEENEVPTADSAGSDVGLSPRSKVIKSPNWPILQCDNIFVLPGIPQYFRPKMSSIATHFLKPRRRKITRKVVLDLEERVIVHTLDTLVLQNPLVKFGSYPFVDHPEYKTIITVEAFESNCIDQAVNELLDLLPPNAVLRVEKDHEAERQHHQQHQQQLHGPAESIAYGSAKPITAAISSSTSDNRKTPV